MKATALVLLGVASCSPFFVQGPPADPQNQFFNCTERGVAPLVDLAMAAGWVAVPIYVEATPSPECTEGCGADPGLYVIAGVLAAAFAYSAYVGNRRAEACTAARARYAP